MAISSTQESIPRVVVSPRSGRVKLTAAPPTHVTLASSRASRVILASTAPIQFRGQTMDGIPEITVRQWQRVTLLAYVETVEQVAITQATTASVFNCAYRPSVDGGNAVLEFFSNVTDAVYDTVQYDAKDQVGYNLKVEYDLSGPQVSHGASAYELETIVELTSGEHIPVEGRVIVQPVYTTPMNAY